MLHVGVIHSAACCTDHDIQYISTHHKRTMVTQWTLLILNYLYMSVVNTKISSHQQW